MKTAHSLLCSALPATDPTQQLRHSVAKGFSVVLKARDPIRAKENKQDFSQGKQENLKSLPQIKRVLGCSSVVEVLRASPRAKEKLGEGCVGEDDQISDHWNCKIQVEPRSGGACL